MLNPIPYPQKDSSRPQSPSNTIPRSVSASEAKARLGALMQWAVENKDDVIIESRGNPRVVIIPFNEYEELQQLKEQKRRQAAIAELRQIAKEVQAQNKGMTAQEADRLADQITREAIDSLVAKGEVRFEQ